jgi:hypothetical protein
MAGTTAGNLRNQGMFMPWFNVGSGSRRAKPKRAQRFQQADRVVVEVFADLHEVGQLKSEPLPEIFTQALVRRRFGIAGIITINPLLPHLHEGVGS